jgi:hypothetical protein
LVLGVAYRSDISDWRESPAVKLIEIPERRSGPRLPRPARAVGRDRRDRARVPLSPADHDIAVIATAHSGIDCAKLVRDAQLVVDLRNATGRAGITSDKIWKLSSVSPTRTSAAGLGTSSISSASWPTSSGSATRTKGASATLHSATPEQERRRRSTMPWRTPRDAAVVATPVPTHCALAKRALEARKRVSLRHRRILGVVHVGDLAGWEAEEGRGGASSRRTYRRVVVVGSAARAIRQVPNDELLGA